VELLELLPFLFASWVLEFMW